ncbi:hypothetical protein KJ785_03180 [Patescibacteria group bacterium]|nr:hypothetical protein [Patescibacteria group bacterium]
MFILVLQRMLLEFILDLLYFPLWWYSGGMKRMGLFCYRLLQDGNAQFVPFLWLKNIFVPMYGQRDIQGFLMSVFIRFWNVIIRSIFLLLWTIFVLIIFLVYLALPIFVLYMILI